MIAFGRGGFKKIVGIINKPVASGGQNDLDMNVHVDSLKRFEEVSNTPMTIGIQGEWGGGETSLINSIYPISSG